MSGWGNVAFLTRKREIESKMSIAKLFRIFEMIGKYIMLNTDSVIRRLPKLICEN